MINRTVLVGRLTKDPELKYTPSGVAVVSFVIAVNRTFTNENGEKSADFINCVVWRKQAESLANYQRKGNLIGIEGRIQTRNYDNQQGQKVYVTEVVADSIQFLEPSNNKNNADQQQGAGQTQSQQQGGGYNQQQGGGYNQQQGGGYNQQQGGGYNQQQGGGYNQQQGGGYNQQQGGGYNQQQGGGYNQQQGGGYNQQQGQSPFNATQDPFANGGGGPITVSEDDLPF